MPNRNNCVEYQVQLEASSVNGTIVWSGIFNSTMSVGLPKYEEGKLEFEINEDLYKSCANGAKLHLSCSRNSTDGNRTTFQYDGLTVDRSNIIGMNCYAKAYIEEESLGLKEFSPCFTDDGSPCDEEKSYLPEIAVSFVGVVLVVGVAVGTGAFIFKKRRNVVTRTIKTERSPSHIIFQNIETLAEDLDTAAAQQDDIIEEYNKFEGCVKIFIDSNQTTHSAKSELNLSRNRYHDVVPFDSNLVFLLTETGESTNIIPLYYFSMVLGTPKSNYINASWVKLT